MSRKKTTPAIAYLRTSSASNVGVDKDSEKRQRVAIGAYMRSAPATSSSPSSTTLRSAAPTPSKTAPGLPRCSTASKPTACARCSSRTPVALPESSWRRSWASRCSSRAAST